MNTVQLSDVRVRYSFRYAGDLTQCVIYHSDTKASLGRGETKRNPSDCPNRVIARKIAFSRAVSQMVDRSERQQMWEHFLANVRYQ